MKTRRQGIGRIAGAALMLAGATLAQAQDSASSATIYGRLYSGLESVRTGSGQRIERMANYRSVLGFRGSEELGEGLRALWQIEGALSLVNGSGSLANRDTRIGLAGDWGTLQMGVSTLPYTAATAAFDPFYPTTAGYMALMGNGSAPNSDHLQDRSSFDRRQASQVQYLSPRLNGLSLRLAHGLNDGLTGAGGARPSLTSAALVQELGAVQLVAAHERHVEYQTADSTDTASKLGLQWRIGPASLAAVLERLKYGTASGALTRDAWYLSGTYRTGAGVLKTGYAQAAEGRGASTETVGFFRSGDGTGAQQLSLGYEHELSRRTSVQVFYSRIANDGAAIYDFAINEIGTSAGQRPSVVSLGLRHAF